MSLSRKIAEVVMRKEIPAGKIVETLSAYDLLSLLPSIKKDLEKLIAQKGDWDRVDIESPFPLNEDALAKVRRIVGNDLAPTKVTINKDLLAGFKARWKGKLYDGSAVRIIKQLINH